MEIATEYMSDIGGVSEEVVNLLCVPNGEETPENV